MTGTLLDTDTTVDLEKEAVCQITELGHAEPCEHTPVAVFRCECGTLDISGALVCASIVRGVEMLRGLSDAKRIMLRLMAASGCGGCGREIWDCWSVVPL